MIKFELTTGGFGLLFTLLGISYFSLKYAAICIIALGILLIIGEILDVQ